MMICCFWGAFVLGLFESFSVARLFPGVCGFFISLRADSPSSFHQLLFEIVQGSFSTGGVARVQCTVTEAVFAPSLIKKNEQ